MEKIKTKNINKTIKTIDRAAIATNKLKNNLVDVKDKVSMNSNSNDEYNSNVIIGTSLIAANKSIKEADKIGNKAFNNEKVKIKKYIDKKKKINKVKQIKSTNQKIKTTHNATKNSKKVAQESVKASERMISNAKKAMQVTAKVIKTTIKATIAAIKALVKAASELIEFLIAGGWIAVVVIVIICLVGLILSSTFGIFFSNEAGSRTMTSVISEINQEVYNTAEHQRFFYDVDDVEINISSSNWKEVIAVYSVKYSNNDNKELVMYLNGSNISKLKSIYYDFNTIKKEVKYIKEDGRQVQNQTTTYIPTGNNNFEINKPVTPPRVENNGEKLKAILYVTIESKNMDEMLNKYKFNEEQRKQVNDLLNSKYDDLWMHLLYGTAGGDYVFWRQKNAPWSSIKIGNTNASIGDIGCLATSIAILIQKSGVNDTIIPFNPGTFVEAMNKVGGFDSDGNIYYGPISKVVPRFKYVGNVKLEGKTKQQKLDLINQYHSQGYYLTVEVKGNTGQHWVAVMSVVGNTINIVDPGSDGTDMWNLYNWKNTSQFNYFISN